MYATSTANEFLHYYIFISDMKKMSDQAVATPYTEIEKYTQTKYTNCNESHAFYFDQNITETFHNQFFSNNSCILPFWYGKKLATSGIWELCKGNQSFLYNDTAANTAFSKTIDSMTILPCNQTKVSFGPIHSKETSGSTELIIKLPRQLEL